MDLFFYLTSIFFFDFIAADIEHPSVWLAVVQNGAGLPRVVQNGAGLPQADRLAPRVVHNEPLYHSGLDLKEPHSDTSRERRKDVRPPLQDSAPDGRRRQRASRPEHVRRYAVASGFLGPDLSDFGREHVGAACCVWNDFFATIYVVGDHGLIHTAASHVLEPA